MCSPSRRVATLLVTAACIALPLSVAAGTVLSEPPAKPQQPAPAPAPSGTYQVRCWQYGRLLFEQRDIELSSETMAGLKIRGTDRNRRPLFVTDTGNATCLIRSDMPARR